MGHLVPGVMGGNASQLVAVNDNLTSTCFPPGCTSRGAQDTAGMFHQAVSFFLLLFINSVYGGEQLAYLIHHYCIP